MREEEGSYYELALSSRQVLVTFIVALACIALAFFAGVWVGQQGDGTSIAVADAAGEGSSDETPALGFFTNGNSDDTDAAAAGEAADPADAREAAAAVEQRPARNEVSSPAASTEPATAARPVRAAPASTGTVAPSGSVVLQVLSSPNRQIAEDILSRLDDGGYSAYMQSFDTAGEVFYRVRVGPFTDRTDADTAKKAIDQAFKVQTWITTAE